uniref:F-box domain-containing protein n=1 Tax=Arcella intermedia TaxID=1963864 RepID=A0A6B2LAL4_9EUKA
MKFCDFTSNLNHLKICQAAFPNLFLTKLANSSKINHLELIGCFNITEIPKEFRDLKHLSVDVCSSFTDLSLKQLVLDHPNLTHLTLNGSPTITDESFAYINTLKSLQYLHLGRALNGALNSVYCYKLRSPKIDIASLTHLDLSGTKNFSNSDLIYVTMYTNNLITLNVTGCDGISDLSLCFLIKKFENLQNLHLSDTNVGDISMKMLGHYCTNLRILDLSGCHNVSSYMGHILSECPYLEKLNVPYCKNISDDSFIFKENAVFTCLKKLNLRNCDSITNNTLLNLLPRGKVLEFVR